ncbi:conserved exported hypothetical protein [Candidatus Sulfopaludibacter sp. SbA3]|nr:conserved exported hypothetical protein [Candidatus Sulfopaludibacter sp. SbA3]
MTSRLRNGALLAALAGFSAGGIRAAEQKTFKTPVAAAQALVAAAQKGAREEVVAILGEELRERLSTGSAAQDQVEKATLLKLAKESTTAKPDERNPNRATVYLGKDAWPFPVPLVKNGAEWRFDAKAGLQEIEDRTIGRNEMGAMAACLAYVQAQLEYASEDRTGEGILQFAQKIRSSPGKHDGLFWSNDKGDKASPLGPFVAGSAARETGGEDQPAPFFGYYYRVLTAQGQNAVGGAVDFLKDGRLLGGFGLVAWPAEYGVTGVDSFVVNQLGHVYEKNLGAQTAEAIKGVTSFDPDKTWKKSE